MGWCSSNGTEEEKYKINQKYLQHMKEQDENYDPEAGLPEQRRKTRAPVLDSSLESEESESDSDDSYINDPDYYNTKARLKSKFMPFILSDNEKERMLAWKYEKNKPANNFPFWPQVFQFLCLEDIEVVILGCKNFYEAAQDERVLFKFLDSDDEDSDSEEEHSSEIPLKKSSNYPSSGRRPSVWKAVSK